MQYSNLLLYSIFCFIGALVPGPTSLLALSNGISRNWKIVVASTMGAALSDIFIVALVGIGLGAALKIYSTLFEILRWLGFSYLIWLSYRLWNSSVALKSQEESAINFSPREAFVRGGAVAVSNPKLILFFAAFIPQFIDINEPLFRQYAAFALISAFIDIFTMTIYAVFGAQAARLLNRKGLIVLNKISAVSMASIALLIIAVRQG